HWTPVVLAGDLAGQHVTERELLRSGEDRVLLGHDAFVERVRSREVADRERLTASLASLGVCVDVEAGAIDRDDVALAARTAFVRLYEEGRLVRDERVLGTCARCCTVLDEPDTEAGVAEAEACLVAVFVDDGSTMTVSVTAPELLPGAVAIAVPQHEDRAGRTAVIPLAPKPLTLVAAEVGEPALLVPAHDADALEASRRLGAAPIEVL